jgi:tetratricopeptide (TPR) repeat protein
LALQQPTKEDNKPMPKQMVDTQLLMAEILLEGKNAKEAVTMYQPLIDQLKGEKKSEEKTETKTEAKEEPKGEGKDEKAEAKPPELDITMLRIFSGSVKAYLELGDFAKAGEAAGVMADITPDDRAANGTLHAFEDLLDKHRKAAETKLKAARDKNDSIAINEAQAKVDATRTALGNLLTKLAGRKRFPVPNLVRYAETMAELGMASESNKLYEQILEISKSANEANKGKAELIAMLVEGRLIVQLRKEGKYAEALDHADALIKAHSNLLDPMIAKALVLQDWADKDASHLDDAAGQWLEVRNMLASSLKKPSDPQKVAEWQKFRDQYYDAIYSAADCRHKQAQILLKGDKTKAVAKATEGAQLLYGMLIQNEKLNDKQETIDKYQDLLKKLKLIISGPSAAKKPSV